MISKEEIVNDSFVLLERLRSQATRMHELDSKIAELETARSLWSEQRSQLDLQLQRYRQIKSEWEWFFDNSLDIMVVIGLDGKFISANKAAIELFGFGKDEMLTKSIFSTIHPDDVARAHADFRKATAGSDRINIELRIKSVDGAWRWISWTTPGFSDESCALYAIGRDITAQKEMEQELLFQVQHDVLTKLKNRVVFDRSVDSAISRAERNPAVQVALLNIDLDGFKAINDTYGHAAGDQVLRTVAARFMELQRVTDVVCRLGGDEFTWIVEGAKPLQVDALAKRIVDAVARPIEHDGTVLTVGCSVGVALFSEANPSVVALCEAADSAMYTVKKSRRAS